jgi:FixJ family two-component response regulator
MPSSGPWRIMTLCAAKGSKWRPRAHIPLLTPRERQVFDLIVRGRTNKQIAHELGTTERTIKAHNQQVTEKANVQSLAELVSVAERLGMLAQTPASPDRD